MSGWSAPASRLVAALGLCLLLLACGSGPAKTPPAPALQAAQRLEQRAVQAFAQGDLAAAEGDYQTAAEVYASLALVEPQQLALLSLARVQAEAGHPAKALATVQQVLTQGAAPGGVSAGTERLAHGRAAALLLATDPNAAQAHLSRAQALCTAPCAQDAALKVLQARLALQQGQAAAALAAAGASLQVATTPADRANALRLRAQAALALQQAGSAASDAAAALALDQQLGLSARVLDDLRCLVDAHRMAGDDAQTRRYQGLLDQALAARLALQGPATPTAPVRAASGPAKAAK